MKQDNSIILDLNVTGKEDMRFSRR